jgi:hypothetical protein
MIIGCGLMFSSAMSGINTVIFYSSTIFGFAGFDEAILATAAVGAVNFIATAIAAYLGTSPSLPPLPSLSHCSLLSRHHGTKATSSSWN